MRQPNAAYRPTGSVSTPSTPARLLLVVPALCARIPRRARGGMARALRIGRRCLSSGGNGTLAVRRVDDLNHD